MDLIPAIRGDLDSSDAAAAAVADGDGVNLMCDASYFD